MIRSEKLIDKYVIKYYSAAVGLLRIMGTKFEKKTTTKVYFDIGASNSNQNIFPLLCLHLHGNRCFIFFDLLDTEFKCGAIYY